MLLLVFAQQPAAVSWLSIADYMVTDSVDLYNGTSGTWSTARLSEARHNLAATSVGNVAIFAGGYSGNNSIFFSVC